VPLYNDQFVDILHQTILHTVRRDGPDLSLRQMALLLITALEEGMHTVRGLAQRLDISKPAITRSLDRLQYLGLSKRKPDPRDGRSVLVVPRAMMLFAPAVGVPKALAVALPPS
jgi:DNA-binding MarR family transcriptional regulator